ncbi:sensor histidine kinase [Aurantiacibacter rhizosphaerae]|uniref:histidine kinase n=1 Tax=Aurantiacibacter rhizosphaerae TaxID=2691582 RepID=A0A844XF15_9SPHN|nr:ATP-binding protein [Aurantiacibacter rhizosphaerae]MWV28339.1 PAS domain-containing protein [Aurantiacibacter rhizosphaerae]
MPFSHLDGQPVPILPEDEGLLSFIVDSGPNLIFVKDEESRILYANQAFLAIYPPDERDAVVGSTTIESFTKEEADLFLSEDRRAFSEGESEIVEEISDWKAQRITLLSRKKVFHTKSGERRLVCISTNITALAARERRLVRLNAKLKVYSHSIAHDLRNPIATMISGLSLIRRDKGTVLSERSEKIMDAMKESATGLSGYIGSMLTAAAEETSASDFQPYDLNILLEEVRFNLTVAIEQAGLRLNVTRLPVARVEPNLLRQLFQNLIENSIKHAGVESPVVTIHHKEEGGEHVFYVGDNGKGIPEEKKALVFSQFFKGGSQDGLGLGLTICQRIANLHDGFIEIHDREENGCCMVVRIAAR